MNNESAGFLARVLATFIDGIVLCIIDALLSIIFTSVLPSVNDPSMLLTNLIIVLLTYIAYLLVYISYYSYFLSFQGATPGKMAMGIRVIDTKTNGNISILKAIAREFFGKTISAIIFGVGFLFPLARDDKKALHDLICGTQVVKNYRK